jgi:hypothetical protein
VTTTTYRVTYYRRGQAEPARVEEFTGLAESTIQVKVEEWREWTNGTATYEVVTPETPDAAESEKFTVKFGNIMGDGSRTTFYTEPWSYQPMAERDLAWKKSDGWDYAELIQVPASWNRRSQPSHERV